MFNRVGSSLAVRTVQCSLNVIRSFLVNLHKDLVVGLRLDHDIHPGFEELPGARHGARLGKDDPHSGFRNLVAGLDVVFSLGGVEQLHATVRLLGGRISVQAR
jgi:hypothetical protein